MMKNPVMFVVEIGFFITLILTFYPGAFGETGPGLRLYDGIICFILFITVLFANFAESIAEGIKLAEKSIDSGAALQKLYDLKEMSVRLKEKNA
jgi:high-affinity K+ transport system ATPase subunit B